MKKELYNQFEEIFNKRLSSELEGLSIGKKANGIKYNQHALNTSVEFEEMIHIQPTNPLFKPGTLLTSQDKTNSGHIEKNCMVNPVAYDAVDDHARIDIGNIRDINELGFYKKVLIPETILITTETIEIRKRIHGVVSIGNRTNKISTTTIYEVRHLLEVINDKEKMLIPTKMFNDDSNKTFLTPEEVFASSLILEDELDLNLIEYIYNSTDPETIIAPLEILKEGR